MYTNAIQTQGNGMENAYKHARGLRRWLADLYFEYSNAPLVQEIVSYFTIVKVRTLLRIELYIACVSLLCMACACAIAALQQCKHFQDLYIPVASFVAIIDAIAYVLLVLSINTGQHSGVP
jgi:hypothetical protein